MSEGLPKLVTADELAERLGVARKTIYNWTCDRRIPFYRLSADATRGGAIRFDVDEVRQWLQGKRVAPHTEL